MKTLKLAQWMPSVTIAVLLSLSLHTPSLAQSAAGIGMVRQDAREKAPEALLGIWKADMGASRYPGQAPLEHLRLFQYTAEGKLMVIFLTLGADGRQTSGHWAVDVDGDPGSEYFSHNRSTVYAEVALATAGANQFKVTETHQGKLLAEGIYTLSEDGSTLTLTRRAATGSESTTIYRRWGA